MLFTAISLSSRQKAKQIEQPNRSCCFSFFRWHVSYLLNTAACYLLYSSWTFLSWSYLQQVTCGLPSWPRVVAYSAYWWMMMLRGFWGQWPRVWSFLEVSTSVRCVCPVLQYYVIGYSLFSLQQQMAANEFCWFFVHWFKGFLCIGQESPTPGLRSRAGNHFLFHCVVWYFIPSSCRGWLLNRREGELCGSVTFWSTLQAS